MPREIFDENRFIELADRSFHCRVKRVKENVVKLKLRTRKILYTYKTTPEDAERLLKNLPCDIIEL